MNTDTSGNSRSFRVSDFGAVGDGATNDGPAVRRAIAAAVASGPGATVNFDPVTYRLDHYKEADYHIPLRGTDGLTLEGNGAELLNAPTNGAFGLTDCRNVRIRGFCVDHAPYGDTQGTIDAVNATAGHFDVQVHPGFPLPPHQEQVVKLAGSGPVGWAGWGAWAWGSVLDPVERRLRRDAAPHYFIDSVVPVPGSPGTYRVTVRDGSRAALGHVDIGDRFYLPLLFGSDGYEAETRGSNFEIVGSSHVRVEDVTFWSGRSGVAFWIVNNEGPLELSGIKVTFRPGTKRIVTTWRDGMHCMNNRVGPVVEGCLFEGLLDDSINLSARTAMASRSFGPAEYEIAGLMPFHIGDRVLVFDPRTNTVIAETAVVDARPIEDERTRVLLADELEGVVHGEIVRDRDIESTHFYNMDRINRGFVVRNCRFGPQRRHAMLIRSVDGVMEGNTIDGVRGSAVSMGNEMGSFYEGPFPHDNVIRANTIRACGSDPITIYTSSIDGTAELTSNVSVVDNEVHLREGQEVAVRLTRVKNATVRDNRITTADGHESDTAVVWG